MTGFYMTCNTGNWLNSSTNVERKQVNIPLTHIYIILKPLYINIFT